MRRGILYAVACCIACAGFVGWRVHAVRTQAAPHVEIVEDPSLSHAEGCEAMLGLAEQALRAEGVSSRSTLTVLVLGNEATANEPWRLGRYAIPTTRKALEGRAANLRRQQDVLRDIWSKCQTVRRTTISPIFLGVKQAIADLRAQGCTGTSRCRLLVDSDLEENAETSIEKSLNSPRGGTRILPSPINNEGIEVDFCGLAVTAGRIVDPSGRETRKASPRNSSREDRLRQVWRTLFTRPEAVRFEPYCPTPPDLGWYPTGTVSAKERRKP
jgi:hypothetical protein